MSSRIGRELKRLGLERRRLQIQRDEHHANLLRLSPGTLGLIDARLCQLESDIRQAASDLLAQHGSEPVPERLVNDLMAANGAMTDAVPAGVFGDEGGSVVRRWRALRAERAAAAMPDPWISRNFRPGRGGGPRGEEEGTG